MGHTSTIYVKLYMYNIYTMANICVYIHIFAIKTILHKTDTLFSTYFMCLAKFFLTIWKYIIRSHLTKTWGCPDVLDFRYTILQLTRSKCQNTRQTTEQRNSGWGYRPWFMIKLKRHLQMCCKIMILSSREMKRNFNGHKGTFLCTLWRQDIER